MSENNKALLSGMGPLNKVAEAWMSEIGDMDSLEHDVREASILLISLLKSHEAERAALALACAVLNRKYRDGMWLLHISDGGAVLVKFESDDTIRETLALALNL